MKVFIEEQRFTQPWIHVLLAISFIIPVFLISKELMAKGWQNEDARVGFIVMMISTILTYGLLFSLKLKTKIDDRGVKYRFIPFHFSDRLIEWGQIKDAYVRKYDPISDYGGWGIKGGRFWKSNKGIAYNVKGEIGIQLILQNGKKILIGTQRQNEAKRVLASYFKV